MVSEKSKANLRRGNPGKRDKSKGNRNATTGRTWRDLIIAYGETQSDVDPSKTWKQVVVEAAYRQAALGNAPILRELMQRSEPQDETAWLVNLDLAQLPREQVERIANGEDPRAVIIATAGTRGD